MKNNDNVTITFNDECYWEWEEWMETYIREVLGHAKVEAKEIYAEDVEDDEQINLCVKELDAANGEHSEKKYAIRFFEDCAVCGCRMFAHFLWQVDGYNMKLIDQAIYQIHQRENGTYYCLLLAEE